VGKNLKSRNMEKLSDLLKLFLTVYVIGTGMLSTERFENKYITYLRYWS
jgi:hypothetical protein